MNKDNYRDYVADAYRYFAQCGKPNNSELRQLRTALPNGYRGGLSDLEAVSRVLERLALEPDGETWVRCLDIVYFSHPRRSPTRGALTERVRIAALSLAVSEATVYRMLRRLRTLLAMERGLRIDERELSRLQKRLPAFSSQARQRETEREP